MTTSNIDHSKWNFWVASPNKPVIFHSPSATPGPARAESARRTVQGHHGFVGWVQWTAVALTAVPNLATEPLGVCGHRCVFFGAFAGQGSDPDPKDH